MRIADPVELKADQPLEPVLTAAMPRLVVDSLSGAMHDVDQLDAPGPSRMAVLLLDAGVTVAVVYHDLKNILEILAPLNTPVEAALAEIVTVLRIPRTSIEWVRPGISLSHVYGSGASPHESGSSGHAASHWLDLAPSARRFWRIAATESLAEKPLAASESISLTLLILRLMHTAGDIEPIDDTPVRVIRMSDAILFEDGAEAAPLAVFFRLSEDGSTAIILDVQELPPNRVHVAKGTLTSAIETAHLAEWGVHK